LSTWGERIAELKAGKCTCFYSASPFSSLRISQRDGLSNSVDRYHFFHYDYLQRYFEYIHARLGWLEGLEYGIVIVLGLTCQDCYEVVWSGMTRYEQSGVDRFAVYRPSSHSRSTTRLTTTAAVSFRLIGDNGEHVAVRSCIWAQSSGRRARQRFNCPWNDTYGSSKNTIVSL
jgi:hypothetical protein